MQILLIFPPIRENDLPRNFPTGIGIIAQVLRDKGYKITLWDINGYRWTKEEVAEKIKKVKFDIVGIGGLVTVYKYIKWLVPLLKKRNPRCKIIVGGPVGTFLPELILEKNEVDVIVNGEGERTIIELVAALENNENLKDIKGIYFKQNGQIIKTENRELIKNLDEIPYPAWDLFPMEEVYMKNPVVGIGRDMDIISSRGCPYKCIFCCPSFGRKYRFRSAENIINEIKELKQRYNIDFISFQDDCFIVNKKRVYEFCDLLMKENLNIKWSCTGRVNIVDKELLKTMKKAGCVSVSYGIESGSQKILNILKKRVTVEEAKQAILLTKEVGLRHPTSFMIGAPYETIETIEETINFCKEVNIPLQAVMFVTPYPGTPLYYELLNNGKIKNLEEFVLMLGDALEFTINLTEFTDEQLINLREYMINEVKKYYKPLPENERIKRDIELYGEELYKKGLEQMKTKEMQEHRKKHGFNE